MYIFVLKKACGLAAGRYRLNGFEQKAAGNGSCSHILRGGNLHPCCSLFVAQIVPKHSQSREAQAVARLLKGFMGKHASEAEPVRRKRSFGPACKDSELLLALLK